MFYQTSVTFDEFQTMTVFLVSVYHLTLTIFSSSKFAMIGSVFVWCFNNRDLDEKERMGDTSPRTSVSTDGDTDQNNLMVSL